jgi:mannose-6-phosphate isomerase-like protein (cupin superfamily)
MGSVIVIPTGAASTTRQGLTQFEGISAESAGARALCAHLLAVPPGGRAKAHRHAGHETAIYVLEGRGVLWFGEELESRVDVGPGDFLTSRPTFRTSSPKPATPNGAGESWPGPTPTSKRAWSFFLTWMACPIWCPESLEGRPMSRLGRCV